MLAAQVGGRKVVVRPSHEELSKMLAGNQRNKAALSKVLGVARSTLYRWLREGERSQCEDEMPQKRRVARPV